MHRNKRRARGCNDVNCAAKTPCCPSRASTRLNLALVAHSSGAQFNLNVIEVDPTDVSLGLTDDVVRDEVQVLFGREADASPTRIAGRIPWTITQIRRNVAASSAITPNNTGAGGRETGRAPACNSRRATVDPPVHLRIGCGDFLRRGGHRAAAHQTLGAVRRMTARAAVGGSCERACARWR